MKAVILAAGYGTRMRPYTYSKPKHMLPLANKPVLEHVIDNLRDAGIREILIVVGHLKEGITGYFGDGSDFGVKISYIEQVERKGLAHAVNLAKEFVQKEPFAVILGDIIFTSDFSDILRQHGNSGAEATVLLTRVDNPSAFGVVQMEGNEIKKLVEKPKVPPSDLAIAGVYVFSSDHLFKVIQGLKPSARGEYEITDAIQGLINERKKVCGIVLERWWKDTGNPKDLLETNRAMLDERHEKKAVTGKGCTISPDSKLIPPVIIGDNCRITSSSIGPYDCIQKNTSVEKATIRNSIVMDNTRIVNIDLNGAVIGSHCLLESDNYAGNHTHTYYIGDNSRISICEKQAK